jgi:hypothetical protein
MAESTDKTRHALLQAYPGKGWAKKVNKMTDSQVTAVYLRLRAQGKI